MICVKIKDDLLIIPKAFLTIFAFYSIVVNKLEIDIHYKVSYWSLITFQVIILLLVLYYGFGEFPQVSPLEKIFEGKSGNGITSYTVVLQIHLYFLHLIKKEKNDIILYITLFFTLLISLSTWGRGSLISSIGMIAITLTLYRISKFFYILIIPILIYFGINEIDAISDFLNRYTKLGRGLDDYNRIEALIQYLSKIEDLNAFIFGGDYNGTIIERGLSGNPHNSFIRAHHNFGIIYIIFILIYTFISIYYVKELKKRILFCALYLILYFRIWTEPVLFPTIFDYFYFCIIIYTINNERRRKLNP